MEALSTIQPYVLWIIPGFALIIAEMLILGALNGVLLLMGVGFLATAFLTYAFNLPLNGQLIVLAVCLIASLFVSRYLIKRGSLSADTTLNDRDSTLLGKVFSLHTDAVNGAGEIKIGDALYTVYCEQAPAGTRVVLKEKKGMGFEASIIAD